MGAEYAWKGGGLEQHGEQGQQEPMIGSCLVVRTRGAGGGGGWGGPQGTQARGKWGRGHRPTPPLQTHLVCCGAEHKLLCFPPAIPLAPCLPFCVS
jgi:hypothetical protein